MISRAAFLSADTTAAAASLNVTLPSVIEAGDWIVCVTSGLLASSPATSETLLLASTGTTPASPDSGVFYKNGAAVAARVWAYEAAAGDAGATLTLSALSGTSYYWGVSLAVYRGAGGVDVYASPVTGTGSPVGSPQVTASNGNDWAVCMLAVASSGSFTAGGTPYAPVTSSVNWDSALCDSDGPSGLAAGGTEWSWTSSTYVHAVFTLTLLPAFTAGNVVSGNVINDYGLDNVPYTVAEPGKNTMLAAFIGWDVATESYQSSGKSPAVNVTDSAGNLWRQAGISVMTPTSRCALWVADNPRQTEWVSVALTGWGYSTGYTICELDGVPASLGAVSLDFVQTAFSTAPTTSLALPAGTASTTDLLLAVVATGGAGGSLTVPTGLTGISAVGGSGGTGNVTTYSMWNPNAAAGTYSFTPTWANSVPVSGIVAGLKLSAPAPYAQSNENFPVVQVECAFGATPGDWTQSVDYTWDVTGLTWTDITTRVLAKHNNPRIKVKRGRQYELSQEETGELDITLDNHDGVFTSGNTASPYYPHVVPGVPVRVTAWWDGVQYPVGFGYAERWPQEWPDMPQWGFSTLVAVDAYGPLASDSLMSAVMGDIRKDYPYAYFPTQEQYEFTTQSLTPIRAPLDANGLIAVNYAFGNNRYGVYRDGTDQPVTVGQALNLLGDENTTLGISSYTAQETGLNGPGMFYFDPDIPTNAGGNAFSVEFWFVWGNTNAFATTLFTAWGRPSSFYVPSSAPTNGGVITVSINANSNESTVITQGLFVNGVEITGGSFNQATFAPQHFVLTGGPNGTACYLNGVQQPHAPVLGTIPQIRAVSLGPARFTYDVSDLCVYDGYNYVAGHLAWYPQELTPTMISNHYESGLTGFVGDPAPGRFAQVLTWGLLGLKRGGTAWWPSYGNPESTYMSEAYAYFQSSASDVLNQLVQSEGGRCYTQGNGSLVYTYRWSLYDQPVRAVFGDSGMSQYYTAATSMGAAVNWGYVLGQFTGAGSAPTFYGFGAGAATSVQSVTVAASGTVTQGDLAVAMVLSGTPATFTVTDSAGNTWLPAGGTSSGTVSGYLFTAHAAGGLGATSGVTVSASGTVPTVAVSVFGASGMGTFSTASAALGVGSAASAATVLQPAVTGLVGATFSAGYGGNVPSGWTSAGTVSGVGLDAQLSWTLIDGTELPFLPVTNFSLDNQFIYNMLNATQQRGPNQDLLVQQNAFSSQSDFFLRSGFQLQSYAMLPFDVFDAVNWATAKYRDPLLRVSKITVDAGGSQALNTAMFPTILGVELNQVVTVNRRPVGGAVFSSTGVVEQISHEIGPAYWRTTLQVFPDFPEGQAMITDTPVADTPGSSFLSW